MMELQEPRVSPVLHPLLKDIREDLVKKEIVEVEVVLADLESKGSLAHQDTEAPVTKVILALQVSMAIQVKKESLE